MVQYRSLDAVRRLATKALAYGATRVTFSRIEWEVGAKCDGPLTVEIVGRGDRYEARSSVNPGHLSVLLTGLPCRKCTRCLRIRAARWAERAMTEIASSDRTWFCTLTLKPEVQHRVFMEELAARYARGWSSSDISEETEFLLRCQGGFNLVTKFWKNVRKPQADEEPVRLKYLVVAERHVSGLPHYHAFVHEKAGSITYRRLADRWTKNGFFHAKLVGSEELSHTKSARYLTKYIAKDMLCRVRASQRYGLHLAADSLLDAIMREAGRLWTTDPLSNECET